MEFQVIDFDRTRIDLIKRLLKYFQKEYSYTRARTWDENTGFYEDKTFNDLEKDLSKTEKKYTGLDEIDIFNGKNQIMLSIIFHEDLCILNVNVKERLKIENDLHIKLKPIKNDKEKPKILPKR